MSANCLEVGTDGIQTTLPLTFDNWHTKPQDIVLDVSTTKLKSQSS